MCVCCVKKYNCESNNRVRDWWLCLKESHRASYYDADWVWWVYYSFFFYFIWSIIHLLTVKTKKIFFFWNFSYAWCVFLKVVGSCNPLSSFVWFGKGSPSTSYSHETWLHVSCFMYTILLKGFLNNKSISKTFFLL